MNKLTALPWAKTASGVSETDYPDIWDIKSKEKNDALPFAKGASGFTVATVEGRANAEFIVRACNSHDDLLEAAKLIAEDFHNTLTGTEQGAVLNKAIQKAEGKNP